MTFLHFSDDIKPFEVKCGSRLSHKPLDKFMNRYAEWLSPPPICFLRTM